MAVAQVSKLEEELETLRDITSDPIRDGFYDSIILAVENHLYILKTLIEQNGPDAKATKAI